MNVGSLKFAQYSNFAEKICALIKVNDSISNLFFSWLLTKWKNTVHRREKQSMRTIEGVMMEEKGTSFVGDSLSWSPEVCRPYLIQLAWDSSCPSTYS